MRGQHGVGRRGSALLLGLVVLAGCGTDAPSSGAPASTTAEGVGTVTVGPDGVQEITLQTQDDYVFTPDTFTVEPGTVRLTVVNVAKNMTHNFRFTPDAGPAPIGEEIDLLTSGQEVTIEFEVTEPGDYPFQCTFHLQLNQVGTMTVRS
jgi:plastocyanin